MTIDSEAVMVIDFGGYYARKPEAKDLEALYQYRNDPGVYSTLGGFYAGLSRPDLTNWIQRNSQNDADFVWVIAENDTDNCIGHCGLYKVDVRSGRAEVGTAIARDHWGRGLGGRVFAHVTDFGFRQLRLNRIETFNLKFNDKVVRIKEKLGYKLEGVLREYQYRDGQFVDVMVMAVLARDWRGIPASFVAKKPRARRSR